MSTHDDRPDDELTRRYREANEQERGRPGAQVRLRVQAHARAVLEARQPASPTPQPTPQREAANQPRWKISMLASIALAGLTGLLVLQFDRGTHEEKELAMGQPRAAAPSPEKAASEAFPEAAPLQPQASIKKPAPALKAAEPARQAEVASGAESRAASGRGRLERQASVAEAAAVPTPFPASPPATALPPPPAMADRASPAPAPAMAAAPAPEPRAQAAKPQARFAAPLAGTDARTNANSLADAQMRLLDAARTGRTADITTLLQQGAPINATDTAGRTALMLAVIHGHEAAVQQLLRLGANPALVDAEGLSALGHARKKGLERMAALLEAAR